MKNKWRGKGNNRERDGLTIRKADSTWIIASDKTGEVLFSLGSTATDTIDQIIPRVDLLRPPSPWTFSRDDEVDSPAIGEWQARVGNSIWTVASKGGSWSIFRASKDTPEEREQLSSRLWHDAHKAREWAEVRFDRSEQSLRGPKPRSRVAAQTRIDIRLTHQERAELQRLADDAGVGYGPFVRAAIRHIRGGLEAGRLRVEHQGRKIDFAVN
jgi:hypothetical protein